MQPNTSDSSENADEYEEDVAALAKIVGGKTPPAAQTVQQLLDSTRSKRTQWLKELISISDIFEKYPCLKISKWVCIPINMHCIQKHALRPLPRGIGSLVGLKGIHIVQVRNEFT